LFDAKIIKIFFWGFSQFPGLLPLGTLNVAAMQIGIGEYNKCYVFFFGSLLVEMIYVRISLWELIGCVSRKS
jgi:hypothetical protein